MSPGHTWFVTGTDTNAGKTCVAEALLRGARAMGLRAKGYKPVESGVSPKQASGADARHLAAAAESEVQASYVFEAPVAPLLAAKLANETISIARIQARTAELQESTDLLIVEGAGGLLVPLAPEQTIADLALAINQPLLIVAPDVLGAINHSLLTIECARQRGLRILALVLSEREAGSSVGLGNRELIEEYGKLTVFSLAHVTSKEELANAGKLLLQRLLEEDAAAVAAAK